MGCIEIHVLYSNSSSQFFPGHGNFRGKVVEFDKKGGLYQVEYEDGDREELTELELKKILATAVTTPSAPKTPDGRMFPNGLLVKKVRFCSMLRLNEISFILIICICSNHTVRVSRTAESLTELSVAFGR